MSPSVPRTFPLLDRLVSSESFGFQSWNDRYSKGVWAALGPTETSIDVLRDYSSAGDLDMIPAMEYAFSAEWLPWVTARTLGEAMLKLEAKLALLPPDQLVRSSEWSRAVYQALEDLSCLGDISRRNIKPLPASYVQFAADRD